MKNVTRMPLLSIAQQWDAIAREIYTAGVSQVQYRETRKAFYAGFVACFGMSSEVARHYTEDECIAYLKLLQKEMFQFEDELRAEIKERTNEPPASPVD